jgi:hypothetical protein
MALLLSLLLGGIEASSTTYEPPLPVRLILADIETIEIEAPDRDALWRVDWIEVCLLESPADAFVWPQFTIRPYLGRLQDQNVESGDPYYASRIDLGMKRLLEMEAEPRFFPAVSEAIFGLPLGLLEAFTTWTAANSVVVNGKQVFNQVAAEDDLATITGYAILHAEMKFLAGIQTSYVTTTAVGMGTEEYDMRRVKRMQWRAVAKGLKEAYRERYQVPAMDLDTIISTVSTGDWLDFVIIPAAVSAYAARFGIERKFRLADEIKVELQIEKFSRFQKVLLDHKGGRVFSMSLNFFKMPVSAIVSMEGTPHGLGYAFIGIGTDINAALTTVYNNRDSVQEDRDR